MKKVKIKIQKSVSHRKINSKSISNTNSILPILTQSKTSRTINRKIISPPKIRSNLIETQVSTATKKIEIDKINLRILKERLNQKEKLYNSLEGKPQKIIIKKETKIKHKFFEEVKRKIGRERELIEKKIRSEKEKEKSEYDFKKLTDDIDNLIQDNINLKKEIQFQRKKKLELENIKEKIKQEISFKKNQLNSIIINSHHIEKKSKINILNEEANNYKLQEIKYESTMDYLEQEYNKVVQRYIKYEREKINESNFNRQVNELRNKGNINVQLSSGKKGLELKKELEKFESEKISDRTPILDECLEKWRIVNKEKKESINQYIKNCTKIREIFDKLILYLNLDSYQDLPEIFKKTEKKESDINIQLEKNKNENDKLEKEKQKLISIIESIKAQRNSNILSKNKFIEKKSERIKVIDNVINKLKRDIEIKEKLFEIIQPETDKFLSKLNNTYLSEFLPNKNNLKENQKYNYLNVNKYISNVEDYFDLIQQWKENNNTENFEFIENQNFEKLNSDIKQKLDNFDKYKLIHKSLAESMKIDRKNGFSLNEIIKNTSWKIVTPINYNSFNQSKICKSKYNKSKERTTENSDDENFKFPCETQSHQQSSILIPNSSRNKNYK